ncbi:FkbM family methyltransferase [Massilia sp. TS11]|uniref:FkbM family methyltransferase n=1 Tax=Massilia sp. TS11 TaxID=2908003 RepID=UPI001EDB2AD6|nr:FkbM family methyltransferase [Massilia sp. TS11]MCG2583620.1 FkbM family methyltransferase [Massilia sp. TS11]
MNYFLSYAQNHEDVLLWRALGHIKNGFYIDVGANDPTEHSVTRAFYERGWWGINVEPLPRFVAAFREQRPRDVNLAVAAGAKAGRITLYDVTDISGWSTTTPEVAARIAREGHATTEVQVEQRTLASICAEHARGDIHFLKIDVEGFEGDVLRGMDFGRWRPWVLVIEATEPASRTTNHAQWEALVTRHGYRFVWFDGLNRYYIAPEHPELAEAFTVQPNVFDAYISWHLDGAWRQLEAAAEREQRTLAERDAARADYQALRADLAATIERSVAADAARRASEARLQEAEAAAQEAQRQLALLREDLAASQRRQSVARARLLDMGDANERLSQDLHAAQTELAQTRASLAETLAQRDAIHVELSTLYQNAAHLQAAHDARGARIGELEQQLHAVYHSRSWRITAPLRFVLGLRHGGLRTHATRLLLWLKTQNWARRVAKPLMQHVPGVNSMAQEVLDKVDPARQSALPPPPPEDPLRAELSHDARAVLDDLQRVTHSPREAA